MPAAMAAIRGCTEPNITHLHRWCNRAWATHRYMPCHISGLFNRFSQINRECAMNWGFKKPDAMREDRPSPADASQLNRLRRSGRFHGVQIHRSSCKACSQLAGKIFSLQDAPKLPLRDCDAGECSCQYLGVSERRQLGERRSSRDRRANVRMSIDRRFIPDRRLTSDVWKGFDH